MKRVLWFVLLSACLEPSFAESNTSNFIGRVTDSSVQLEEVVEEGAIVEGTYTFETSESGVELTYLSVGISPRPRRQLDPHPRFVSKGSYDFGRNHSSGRFGDTLRSLTDDDKGEEPLVWTLSYDPSNSIVEFDDGLIRLFGGNAVEGSLIDGNPVIVIELQLLRPPYTLNFDTGELALSYVDEAGVYWTAYVWFEPLEFDPKAWSGEEQE